MAFAFIDCVSFEVELRGSTERLGLSESTVRNYIGVRVLNDLSFVPSCTGSEDSGQLYIYFFVWTVGDDYPVAYHVEVASDLVLAPDGVNDEPYRGAYLGYARSTQIRGEVEEIIQDEVRRVALKLAAMR